MTGIIEISNLRREIESICKTCHRDPSEVKILAVSKLQPVEKIQDLISKGQFDFGENYVQEFIEKQKRLPDERIKWHLIGHLQKNKVKFVTGKCDLIHSVDSISLAKEISRRITLNSNKQKILLQVNVADENSKEGFELPELMSSISEILHLPGISVCGLMTMPPFVDNPEENRAYFRKLKGVFQQIKSNMESNENFTELSMGTSQDYRVAIEEGATWVRLGSSLFGSRPHQPRQNQQMQ